MILDALKWIANFKAGQLTQVSTGIVVLSGVAHQIGWIDDQSYQYLAAIFGGGIALGIARKPLQS